MTHAWILWLPAMVAISFALLVQLVPTRAERVIARVSLTASAFFALSACGVTVLHRLDNGLVFDHQMFAWGHEHFNVRLFSDSAGLVFLWVTAFFFGAVVRFSQRYLHRDPGYRRFFATLLLFVAGMSVLALAADLETLFIGWEVVGLSSFLLIGFYRERAQPLRNAQKAYAVYRLTDVGLLVGAFLEHKLVTQHATFAALAKLDADAFTAMGSWTLFGLSALILLAAAGKSAQVPFSFWLPRAMEGPTPSSAIFYGALSVHAGVLLLLRTLPIWQASRPACGLVFVVGALSALLATAAGRVQSTIKGQIAYASITQVGLMFVELALGFPTLALIHFVANASLRCYQLLVSPSIVAYVLRRQSSASGHSVAFRDSLLEKILPSTLRSTLYCFASSEGYLETIIAAWVCQPLIALATWLEQYLLTALVGLGAVTLAVFFTQPASFMTASTTLVVGGLVPALTALVVQNLRSVWLHVSASNLLIALGIGLHSHYAAQEVLGFAWGVLAFAVLGYVFVRWAKGPQQGPLVFVCLLGLIGFPLSPVFFGEDLLLDAALRMGVGIPVVVTGAFVLSGIALMRAYARTFFLQQGASELL